MALGVFAGLLATGPALIGSDGDTLTHAVVGRALLSKGWPTTDPLLDPPVPVALHEWAYEVLLALSGTLLGTAGYVLFAAVFICGALFLAVRHMERSAGAWPTLLLGALGFPLLYLHLHARPHVASWFAVVVLVLLLEHARTSGTTVRFVGALGLLGVCWANLHGGFLIGPVLFGAFAVDALRRPDRWLWLSGAATFGLATFVNPDGPWLHVHLLGFLTDPEARAPIADLQATAPTSPQGLILLFWTLVGLALLRRGPASHVLVTLALGALTWRMTRNAPLFVLATAPLFANTHGPDGIREASRRLGSWFAPRSTGLAPAVVLLLAALTGPLWAPRPPASVLPMEALRSTPMASVHGAGLTVFHWGGAVVHERPDLRVFIHPLNALYPRSRQRAYARLASGELDALPEELRWALVELGTPMEQGLRDAGWRRVHDDDVASLWLRPE